MYFLLIRQENNFILIYSHWVSIVVLTVVIFLFDILMEKRSVTLTSYCMF